ncbi:hypothetical protein IW262DRAFT_1033650, partial [Armillaria fumosa]
ACPGPYLAGLSPFSLVNWHVTAILARIVLHSESSATMHVHEVVFELVNRDVEPVPWRLNSFLNCPAPESVRAHPEATLRL